VAPRPAKTGEIKFDLLPSKKWREISFTGYFSLTLFNYNIRRKILLNNMQKINKIYPLQIEFITLFLVFVIFYLTFSNYFSLPDRIPTHFDIHGLPDGWGNKNEILIYPITGFAVFALITGISLALAVTKNPKSLINLPTRIKDKISEEQTERLRIILVRCLVFLKILILGQTLYLLYGNIQTAFGRSPGLGDTGIFVFVTAIVCVVFYMVYKSFRISYSGK
jgi:uncharacterized membrane protein